MRKILDTIRKNVIVRQSQNAILCFMHDDIVCHTKGLGLSDIVTLSRKKVGMIGVASALYLSDILRAGTNISSENGTICHNSYRY